MAQAQIIKGGQHTDSRGRLNFINDFDMKPVRRFYTIEHADITTERGWRAHKIEQRWFHVSKGIFKIKLIKIDDWVNPSKNLPQELYVLSAEETSVLHVPAGYASSLQALVANAKIIVFADHEVEHAKHDDYLFPLAHFEEQQQ